MKKKPFSWLIGFVMIGLVSDYAKAHNGTTCYASPVTSNILIDGDLTDWPEAIQYPVGSSSDADFNAYFMTAYNPLKNALYVAMKVTDDINFLDENGGSDWNRTEDRHILFMDFDHSIQKGSGVVAIFGNQNGKDISYVSNGWDPFHQSVGLEDIELAIDRHEGVTTYEWQIQSPVELKPNLSLGMDHYVHDVDEKEKEVGYYEWGAGGFKDRMPFRLGDIVLLPDTNSFGLMNSKVSWQDGKDNRALPTKIAIQSKTYPSMWTTVELDSTGSFTKTLPEGTYKLMPIIKTATTNGIWDIERIDDANQLSFEVKKGHITNKLDYKMSVIAKPDFLIPAEGILNSTEPFDQSKIDVVVEAFKDYYQIPGVSLAVIKDGLVLYEQQYGTSNTTTNEPVSKLTRFEIASVSKPVFAFAVHRLAQRGLIDLDEPLYKYKEFKSISHDARHKLITARLVLSHQTGMPNWLWNSPRDWENGASGEFIGDPNSGFYYSGEMYEYLMRVVEDITGNSIEQIIQEEVFNVFGMTQSSHVAKADFYQNIAVGHLAHLPMFWNVHDKPWVAGSMYSTVSDLSKFTIGILNRKGMLNSQYDIMLVPQVEIEPWVFNYGGHKQYWSLGFEVEDTPYGRFYHHDGSNGDFESRIAINPEKGYGYILLTNNGNGEYLDRVLQRTLFTGRQDRSVPIFD